MIKTKIGNLLAAKPFLQQLANTEMSAKEAFKVLKTLKVVDNEYETVHSTRIKLIEKYAQYDDNHQWKVDEQGNVLIVPDKLEDFNKEQRELLGAEITLDCEKLELAMLEKLTFTPKLLMDLEDFLNLE